MRYMHPPIMQMKGSTSPKPFLSSSYWYLYSSSSSSSTTFWCAMVCENLEDIKSYIREWTSGPLWFKAYIFANINYNGAILGWHILFYNLYWNLGYLPPPSQHMQTWSNHGKSWKLTLGVLLVVLSMFRSHHLKTCSKNRFSAQVWK